MFLYYEHIHRNVSEEILNWLEQSEKDMRAAKNSLTSGDYGWAIFQAHQSVEKALKAVHIKKYKNFPRMHDLVSLAKKINAPRKIIAICGKINPAYLDTRYPDIPKSYKDKEASEIIELSKEVLE